MTAVQRSLALGSSATYPRQRPCNPLGMLAEHIDPISEELWGNFPQTYSMVGIINGATRLSRRWETVL